MLLWWFPLNKNHGLDVGGGVQQLMDELELPPDRANLFEAGAAQALGESRGLCHLGALT